MMDVKSLQLFTNQAEGIFLSRPNRFVVEALVDGQKIRAHCPNPGRLLEILLPKTQLIFEYSEPKEEKTSLIQRKTQWTLVAARYKDRIVPLYSARANQAAQHLVLPRLFPEALRIQPEFALEHSRFDFLVIDKDETKHLVEVKACTEVEYDTALFPDAPSLRASRHLQELAQWADKGYTSHILFIMTHGRAQFFIPNLHTDPLFAQTLSLVASKVQFHTATLLSNSQGTVKEIFPEAEVDLTKGSLAEQNKGCYMILLHLPKSQNIEIGKLGRLDFEEGWYVYCGSAQKGLAQRVARHLRKSKTQHWHLDYLTPWADKMKCLPIASFENYECQLSKDLQTLGGQVISQFGSSDCQCPGHLVFFKDAPLQNQDFTDLLMRYRHKQAFIRP